MSIITFGTVQKQRNQQTEELIDERLNSRLSEAWKHQKQGEFNQAMEIYLEVLKAETLVDSVIDKHLLMQNQCHRNLADVFEHMGAYAHAKHHYTQALKLNPDNSVAWTRLGFICYEQLNDLTLAKQCFVAATKTMPTLERIGSKICPILVKLAEIQCLQAEFEASEKTVDAILTRASADQATLVFANLLKFYFCTLKTQAEAALVFFQKAQSLQPGVKVSDLDLFKRVKARQDSTQVLMRDQSYIALDGTDNRLIVVLQAQPVQTFPAFLVSLVDSILVQSNQEGFTANQYVYDCAQWVQVLQQSRPLFITNWHQQPAEQPEQQTTELKPQPKLDKHKNLRKKPDNTEQQIRAIQLQRFQHYREYLYKDQDFEAQSTSEIIKFANLMRNSIVSHNVLAPHPVEQREQINTSVIDEMTQVLGTKLDKTNCQFFVRNLLAFLCSRRLVDCTNAKHAFRLFQMRLDDSSLDITHPEVVLTMFELALFNQEVIRDTKSGPIMRLRTLLYEYCQRTNQIEKLECPKLRFRHNYAMMFTAFEIKNDMQQAVLYYQQLDIPLLEREQQLSLKWVSQSFQITVETVSAFGNQKIKEAQQINQQNQTLRLMKQTEFESTKSQYQRQPCSKAQAMFFLEQLFLHLQMLIEANDATTNVNFQLNNDKLKEMWDQLMFCLVRVQPMSHFFDTTNHVFCVLSAFKSLARKSLLYETALLKKIDFEPLLQEVSDRTKLILTESGIFKAEYAQYEQLTREYLKSQNVTQLTLSKTQTHIARLVTPEFIFWNVKVGGSMGNAVDPGQPFTTQLLRCLFLLEHVQSNLAKDQMFGIALLMKQLDQMAQDQQELLMRAYSRLFIIAFPLMIRAANNGACHPDFKLLIEKSFKYLFGFVCPEQQSDFSEEMQLDLDEITELSLFAGMQTQADKPKFPVPTPSELFTQMAQKNKKEVDMQLLTDVVVFANALAQGRIFDAQLTARDVTHCVKIADSLTKLLILQKRDEDPLLRQKCFKENPFTPCQIKPNQSVHLVVKFLFNVFGSLAIQVFPTTVVMPIAKRLPLIDKYNALKDLRKLKSLVNIDLASSHDMPATALLCSIIDLQYYMQHVNAKLLQDYKPDMELRQYKDSATNAAIWAIKESLQQGNLSHCLQALHQLLSIFYVRVMAKRDILKPKFQSLVGTSYCLAMVCELVQCLLTSPKRDPRVQQMSIEGLHQQARVVIENLLEAIYLTYRQGQQKHCLIDNIHNNIHSLRILSLEIDQKLYKLLPKQLLNPDYLFLQVYLSRLGPSDVSQLELQVSKKAFDLAVCQNDKLTALESLLHLIERHLKFIVDYKYLHANHDQIKGFLDQTKPFLIDADLFLSKYPNRDEELLYDPRSSHLLRPRLMLPMVDQIVEGVIQRLYKLGDTAVTLISEGTIELKWFSLKFKMMLQSSLISEAMFGNRDSCKLIAESSGQHLQNELSELEEQIIQKTESFGPQPIFCLQNLSMNLNTIQDRTCKSIIAMYFSSTQHKSITEVKLQLKQQLLSLWEETSDYESVQGLYRKQLEIYKKNSDKVSEVIESLNCAKDTLIRTIVSVAQRQLQCYLQLRGSVLEYQKGKKGQQGYTECFQMMKDFRLKYELTPTNNVPLVKDIFELFLDSHYSKQFLRKQALVSLEQKASIRTALLNVCALCGPDEETEPGAPRFLDLHKFCDDDNWLEALQVCVKWYCAFIEHHRKAKKDQDMAKRLVNCVDELKQCIVGDPLMTPKKPLVAKHEVSAAKVFTQKKLI